MPISVDFEVRHLTKLYPLAISRGVSSGSVNLFCFVRRKGHVGIGEQSIGTAVDPATIDAGRAHLQSIASDGLQNLSIHDVYAKMRAANVEPSAMAALDIALWDLHAKECGMPLYRVLGLARRSVPTSVTIGINPPEVIKERVPDILQRTGGRHLKIKLGSPDGIEADQANFEAARESAAPFQVGLRVDANGGWSGSDAKRMMHWLAERGVAYVEQPLAEGMEDALPELFENRPLPIYADESCRFASDVARLYDRVDGVNLKLMKCGGITEAVRIVAAARAFGLGTMIGCMSESTVGIAAGAAIGCLFDHIDLDSHLNLNPDPAYGLDLVEGMVLPRNVAGHGACMTDVDA